jgi:hypothetical protein
MAVLHANVKGFLDSPAGRVPFVKSPGSRWTAYLSTLLIGVFFIVIFSEARYKSPAFDEPPHIAAGLSYFVTHEIFRANPQHPPLLKELSALSMMAAGIHWPHTPDADYLVHGDDPARVFGLDWKVGNELLSSIGPDRVLLWARLPMMLVAALLGVLLYLWGRQLLGSLAATGAVWAFVTDPTILAHSQFVTTDVGVAAFSVLALFALWNYLRRPGWLTLLLCGFALGAALASKFSGPLLVPVFAFLLLAAVLWPATDEKAPPASANIAKAPEGKKAAESQMQRRKDLCPCGSGKKYKNCHGRSAGASWRDLGRKLAKSAGVFALLGLLAFAFVQATLFFPGDLTMYLKCARMVNADHNPNYLVYLAGDLRSRFPGYFPAAYLLKEPIAAIVLASIGLVALLRSNSVALLNKLFIFVPAAAFLIATMALADDLGVRYLIPALPFVHLLAGFGIATLLEARRRFRWTPYAGAAVCGWMLLAAAGSYPDHLSYFNESACLLSQPSRIGWDGGSRCGIAWLDDSNLDWGQGLKQLKGWLDSHAAGRNLNLAMLSEFPAEAYGIKARRLQDIDLLREPSPGLYAVSAHLVARIPAMPGASDWLQRVQPSAIVGHSIYVYDIPAH